MRLTVLCANPAVASELPRALGPDSPVTALDVVVGTGDDITHLGLRVCRTTDAVVDALADRPAPSGDVVRRGLTELTGGGWLPIADEDVARHLLRSSLLARGRTPSEVTDEVVRALGVDPRVAVRPATDAPVETHVVLEIGDDRERPETAVHVREWREAMGGEPLPRRAVVAGLDRAPAAPGVLEAIRSADLVVVLPADPVLDMGPVLGVRGVTDALRGTPSPVVVVDPYAALLPSELVGPLLAGLPQSGPGAARVYRDIADGWVTRGQAEGYARGLRVESVPQAGGLLEPALRLGEALRTGQVGQVRQG